MKNTSEPLLAVESVSIRANSPLNAAKRTRIIWQVLRFGIVGSINTLIDILVFNVLLFCLPTHDARMLLIYNSFAYAIGAVNSYLMNKHWTFHHTIKVSSSEILRFACINIFGIFCNDTIIWLATYILRSEFLNTILWANISKIIAILGTISISYLGMRLWVFASVASNAKPRRAQL